MIQQTSCKVMLSSELQEVIMNIIIILKTQMLDNLSDGIVLN